MSTLEVIKARRSIRKFVDKPVEKEKEYKLIEALIWAPSGGNLQARKFFFVKNIEIKKKLCNAALGQKFIAEAPLVIVCCADQQKGEGRYGERGTHLYSLLDTAASIQNLMLVAQEIGLGTVWVGAFDENETSNVLNLPKYLRPISMIPVGYPAKIPTPTPRVTKEEAVVFVE